MVDDAVKEALEFKRSWQVCDEVLESDLNRIWTESRRHRMDLHTKVTLRVLSSEAGCSRNETSERVDLKTRAARLQQLPPLEPQIRAQSRP